MAPETGALASIPLTHIAQPPSSGAALQDVATDVISGRLPGLPAEAERQGTAAVAYQGAMVDIAMVKMAQQMLGFARALGIQR